MAEKYKCDWCGMVVEADNGYPHAKMGGPCPSISTGRHNWSSY